MKRLIAAAALVLALTAAAASCDTGHRAYCYGEGGQIQGCTSPGSPGSGG